MSDLISKKALLEAMLEDIFAKFLEKHRHVAGGLRVYSDLNEIEKVAARKGIEFCLINLAPPQPQSVKDALEKAINIVKKYQLSRNPTVMIVNEIRKLIEVK